MPQALAYAYDSHDHANEHRIIDLVRLSRATLGDRVLEREVLQLFVRQAQLSLEQLVGADSSRSLMIVHTLKGSARSVGAMRVVAAAEAFEGEAQPSRGSGSAFVQLRTSTEEAITMIEGLLATH